MPGLRHESAGTYGIVPVASRRGACDPDHVATGPKINQREPARARTSFEPVRSVLPAAAVVVGGTAGAGYEVDVDGQSGAAVQDAMRQALVRATGRRESADDPALAGVLAEATRYVKSYAVGPRGNRGRVRRRAVEQPSPRRAAVSGTASARSLSCAVSAPQSRRRGRGSCRARARGAERGLPISLLPLTVVDGDGGLLSAAALLQSRSATVATRSWWAGDGAAPDSELQWTLYTRSSSESWNGPLAAGIDHTVDLLAPQQGASLAQAEWRRGYGSRASGAGRLRRDRASAAERCGRAPRQHCRRRSQQRRLRCNGARRRCRARSGTQRLHAAGTHRQRGRHTRVSLPAQG